MRSFYIVFTEHQKATAVYLFLNVLLVAGVSMYFWYHQDSPGKSASNKPSTPKPILTPYAGPTGGGLAGLIRF